MKVRQKKHDWAIVLVVSLLLVLPAGYLASAGPAAAMVVQGNISLDTYESAYAPLSNVRSTSVRADRAMQWWRRCFVDDAEWWATIGVMPCPI